MRLPHRPVGVPVPGRPDRPAVPGPGQPHQGVARRPGRPDEVRALRRHARGQQERTDSRDAVGEPVVTGSCQVRVEGGRDGPDHPGGVILRRGHDRLGAFHRPVAEDRVAGRAPEVQLGHSGSGRPVADVPVGPVDGDRARQCGRLGGDGVVTQQHGRVEQRPGGARAAEVQPGKKRSVGGPAGGEAGETPPGPLGQLRHAVADVGSRARRRGPGEHGEDAGRAVLDVQRVGGRAERADVPEVSAAARTGAQQVGEAIGEQPLALLVAQGREAALTGGVRDRSHGPAGPSAVSAAPAVSVSVGGAWG